jgi:hypothetical protein
MCDYLDDNNQREIFVDTIQETLIGPKFDGFGISKEEELISMNPVKQYYSGILFSSAFSNSEAVNEEDSRDEEVGELETEDEFEDEVIAVIPNDEQDGKIDESKDDQESANLRFQSYFPTKFGMVFALENSATTLDIVLDYATYEKTTERKIKISLEEWQGLKTALNILNHDTIIVEDFGNGVFAENRFEYVDGILTFNYTPPEHIYLSSKKYKGILNQAFGTLLGLKSKLINQLCATKIYKRQPQIWVSQIQLIDQDIVIPETNLRLYSKVIENNGKNIVKLLVQNICDVASKSYKNCYFQVQLMAVSSQLTDYKKQANSLIDQDFATVDYQYQDLKTYGKGVSCAVSWNLEEAEKSIKTTFLPQEEIKNFSNAPNRALGEANVSDIFKLKNLSIWTSFTKDQIIKDLNKFANIYNDWQIDQESKANGDVIGSQITQNQSEAVDRLKRNIAYLNENDQVFKSFQLANTAMMIQMVIAKDIRFAKGRDFNELAGNDASLFNNIEFFKNYDNRNEPIYRPFQLAFLLMNIEPTFDKESNDRNEIVDLIWFPTGGGKTEAYLALTALTIIERRLHNAGIDTNGVSVMMRYTLRLLTAQQFERATFLICALEFLRKKLEGSGLGNEEITIGMWVGGSTTPNKLKELGEDYKWRRLFETQNLAEAKRANRFPISYCPWCGCDLLTEKEGNFERGFEKNMHGQTIIGLEVFCVNDACHFERSLPISFIDDELYNKPPTLLFATVDKLVRLSHKNEASNLFKSPLPIDLIIQDELHLLTGPLGSLTGLYELAIEQLCNRDGRRPKIVASTATTRNTSSVIKAMYGRDLNVFPAQGVRFDDNFFSYLDRDPKRKHLGVMPTGKTSALTEIKIVEALYEAKVKLLKYFLIEKGVNILDIDQLVEALNSSEFKVDVDPYWTFVFYYNNLRDLGRSKSRVSIDFTQQIEGLFEKQGFEKILKFVHRYIFSRTVEFTSRQESGQIKGLLTRTEQSVTFNRNEIEGNHYIYEQDGSIDLALASNMFSVGIDVTRLNLMMMVGQPGSVAEYIQASSRVARREKGLVINLLNPMRSRELSIFEDYKAFHTSYYKNVEPLSITPFTEMAIDKLMNAVLVAYARSVHDVNNVQGYNQTIKDELKVLIHNASRPLTVEQIDYIDHKLDLLGLEWVQGQSNGNSNITKRRFRENEPYLFDLMHSLRDIDEDVYIENQSL